MKMRWIDRLYNRVKNLGKSSTDVRENYGPSFAAVGNNNLTAIIDSVGLRIRHETITVYPRNYEPYRTLETNAILDVRNLITNGKLARNSSDEMNKTYDGMTESERADRDNTNIREKLTLEQYARLDESSQKEIADFVKFGYARRLKEKKYDGKSYDEAKRELTARVSFSTVVSAGDLGERKIGYELVKKIIDSASLDEIKKYGD